MLEIGLTNDQRVVLDPARQILCTMNFEGGFEIDLVIFNVSKRCVKLNYVIRVVIDKKNGSETKNARHVVQFPRHKL